MATADQLGVIGRSQRFGSFSSTGGRNEEPKQGAGRREHEVKPVCFPSRFSLLASRFILFFPLAATNSLDAVRRP
jgi:hypothetical protein